MATPAKKRGFVKWLKSYDGQKFYTSILFLLIPTTNVRPEIVGGTLWDALMRMLYRIDAPDNLFPSIHCVMSWLCWIAVRERKAASRFCRCFSLIAAVAVCISTLTTRQHVILDAVGGVLLAEGSYYVAGSRRVCGTYSAVLAKLKRVFTK